MAELLLLLALGKIGAGGTGAGGIRALMMAPMRALLVESSSGRTDDCRALHSP